MYNYIKGEITEINATSITIEANNIGYFVKVPTPNSFKINENTIVYIHHYIKDDINILYGFSTKLEKEIFLKLISVKGLGPKGALSILSICSPFEIITAINQSNINLFTKIKGIGKKVSEQIILDLKDKFTTNNEIQNNLLEEVILALKSLGYTNNEISIIKNSLILDDNISLNDAVKKALTIIK